MNKLIQTIIEILKKLYLSPLENKLIVMLMSSGLGLISIQLYSLNAVITYNDISIKVESRK